MSTSNIQENLLSLLRSSTDGPVEALKEVSQATTSLIDMTAFSAYLNAVREGDKRVSLGSLRKSLFDLVRMYLDEAEAKA